MNKRVVITGITGQTGSYLAELLLSKGYEVFGLVRRNSITENQQNRIEHLKEHIHLSYGDVLDIESLHKLIALAKPDEIINLAAQSHVRISYDIPSFTAQVNAVGALNVLEASRTLAPDARVYQASSSEMFGNQIESDGSQNESTKMVPVSPYGASKLFAYNMIRNYRHAYHMFASNGILFNHESPRRSSNFVTSKIVKNAVLISKGKATTLELGNLDSKRDWGHARDYALAIHRILQHDAPDDFVIASGVTRSIRDFCEIVFTKLGLDYCEFVVQNPKFMRPEELNCLLGDSTKARTVLGWQPQTTFDQLVEEMILHWQSNT